MEVNTIATLLIVFVMFGSSQSYVLSDIRYDVNGNNAEIFPWTVMMIMELKEVAELHVEKIYYGSLIHPQVVLVTLPFKLQTRDKLYIFGSCRNFEISNFITNDTLAENCQIRKVSNILQDEVYNINAPSTKIVYYGLLILERPFELNKRNDVIKLYNYDLINENNCFISVLKTFPSRGVYPILAMSSYKIEMTNHLGVIYLTENGKFMDSQQRNETCTVSESKILIERFGSPVVCQHYFDSDRFIQVGFLDSKIEFRRDEDAQIVYESYLDIANIYDETQQKLSDYLESVNVESGHEDVSYRKNNISDTLCPISCTHNYPKKVNAKVTLKINGVVKKSDNAVLEL